MLTEAGETWCQNRLISNRHPVLNKLVLGKGSTPPSKGDVKLENKQIEITPVFDTTNLNRITATVELTALELENITEIGLQAGDILISRDLFNPKLEPTTTKIKVKYSLNLNSPFTPTGDRIKVIFKLYNKNQVRGTPCDVWITINDVYSNKAKKGATELEMLVPQGREIIVNFEAVGKDWSQINKMTFMKEGDYWGQIIPFE